MKLDNGSLCLGHLREDMQNKFIFLAKEVVRKKDEMLSKEFDELTVLEGR